ncbi:MAG: HD domain-containing protein [Syntrophales bacterium LBB04]|nr:HD domain-containing protein [Syntrophales bacterium LBB04]
MNETPSSTKDSSSDLLRLSSLVKQEPQEEGTSSLAGRHTPGSEIHNVDDIYLTARTYMESVRNSVKNHTLVELDPAISLINKIANSTELLFSIHPLTLKFGKEGDYDIFQPVHTMIYALKIGLRLNYPGPKLVELGMATLLQNIGMFLVPDSIINKTGNLTDAEIGVIKKHPEMGRDILLPYQNDYPWLLETIYQHHERENGQGYPRALKGNEICEYAKIIGICDSYEAMTHNRPHKKALMQFDSVRQLIESKDQLFSPQILKVFLEEMSLYPIGSYVKLNNGAIGRVCRTNRTLPKKPASNLTFGG